MVVANKMIPRALKVSKPSKMHRAAASHDKSSDGSPDDRANGKVHLVAQELKFAKIFAGNNTSLSEKQLRKLKKWFIMRSNSSFPFDDQDFLRIWKGLFYCMWMADKPLPQEKLADELGTLVHCFPDPAVAIQFFGMFLRTMSLEWYGIDQWRIDKFMMLVRRVTRQMFLVLHQLEWDEQLIELLNGQLEESVLKTATSNGFYMHFTELYPEELAKVSGGNIPASSVTFLLKPFAIFIAKPRNLRVAWHTVKHIFNNLLFQSELGRAFQDKFEAWKELGFPGKSIDDLELVDDGESDEETAGIDSHDVKSDEDDEADEDDENDEADEDEESGNADAANEETDSERHLDPRAGRVDVFMPEIPFEAQEIIDVLEEIKYKDYTNVKTRQLISRIVNNYSTYASGKFPLGIQSIKQKSEKIDLPKIDDKVNEMNEFERKLYKNNKELKSVNKKKRKRMLRDIEDGLDIKSYLPTTSPPAPKKRRPLHPTLTPTERAKVNTWQEDDIQAIPTPAASQTPISINKKRKSLDNNTTKRTKSPKVSSVEATTPDPMPTKKVKTDSSPVFAVDDQWAAPLADGEIEYVLPSRKLKIAQLNAALQSTTTMSPPVRTPNKMVLNPVAAAIRGKQMSTAISAVSTPKSIEKKVKIMLKMNRSQDTNEYVRQLRSSPNLPYDATKQPTKSLLKPNLMPSPINPYYKRKMGLSFD